MTQKIIVIAAEDDKGLSGEVSHHFGKCPYFVVVEISSETILTSRVEKNPVYENHQPGLVPKFVKGLGADVIIAGGMGPRAEKIFRRHDIDVVTGAAGRVRRVLTAYLVGDLSGIVPCAHDHGERCAGH